MINMNTNNKLIKCILLRLVVEQAGSEVSNAMGAVVNHASSGSFVGVLSSTFIEELALWRLQRHRPYCVGYQARPSLHRLLTNCHRGVR